MADYDAIVIGSGHNGLACALYLADAGWRVVVLERAAHAGGALCTREATLPGFRHDLYATNVGFFRGSPLYQRFKEEFDACGIEFLSNRCSSASVYPGARAVRVYADEEATDAEIAARAPADVAAWRDLVALYRRTAPRILPLYYAAMPSMGMACQLARLAASPVDALRILRIVTGASSAFLEARMKTDDMRGLLAPWPLHVDLGPDLPGSAAPSFIASISGMARGLPIVKGGASRIADALRALIGKRGGTVITGTEVTRIRVRDGLAVAVQTAGGDTISAGRAVIANVTPRRLFGGLVAPEDLPPGFFSRIRRFQYGPGTFVLHLALQAPLQWRAAEDLAHFNTVHVGGMLDNLRRAYAQTMAGMLPEHPLLILGQPSLVDPSRTPPGRHMARIHVRAVPATIQGDAAGRIGERTWDAAKERFADRLLDLLEAHAPNVRNVLLARHAVSPADLERENPNFVGGDCGSGSHRLSQNYFFRPLPGWSRYRTPVRGLYMVGASTWAGASLNATSGTQVAGMLLER